MSITNVEAIIKKLNKVKGVESFRKIDGITIECICKNTKDMNSIIDEVKSICKDLKLPQLLIEKNKIANDKLAIQFPELDVKYSDEEFNKLITDAFAWLVDNMKQNDTNNSINRQVMIDNIGMITKLTTDIYYKSNVNKYKVKIEDLLNDKDFRETLNKMFMNYINTLERGDI